MSKELAALSGGKLPAHLQKRKGDATAWDNVGGESVPRLELTTKHISAVVGGQVVQKSRDPIRAVLISVGPVGRSFYATTYEPGSKELPDCYSHDGKRPARDAKFPESDYCDDCPQNVKGSSKTQRDSKACRYKQNVAVALPGQEQLFRLSLSATSIFPPEKTAYGELALNAYVKALRGLGGGVTPDMVYTSIALDEESDYPRAVFKAEGWLSEDDADWVDELSRSDQLDTILSTTFVTGADHGDNKSRRPADDEEDDPAPRRGRGRDAADDDEPAPRRSRERSSRGRDADDEPPRRQRATRDEEEATPSRNARRTSRADDDDEPAPRERGSRTRARDAGNEDEPAPRRSRARADAAEDDAPRRGRGRDAEEDAPAPRRGRGRDAEPEDDAPPPRRARGRVEEAEDDEPAPRRARGRGRDAADDDEPAPRRARGRDAEPEGNARRRHPQDEEDEQPRRRNSSDNLRNALDEAIDAENE